MLQVDGINFPENDALVLVAYIPAPRDLEIARLFGWYRIPFRTAPKIIQADYLAFYQPSSFPPDERFLLKWFAPVRGVELTTRGELLREEPDHPRANEEYYKIQLGALNVLPNLIRAGEWKRFAFLYTTGKCLSTAHTLKDLSVKNEERAILWRALRERVGSENAYAAKSFEDLPSDILLLLTGELFGKRKTEK